MTKMTKTQRTAILEAHNAPTVGVDEYFSRGYVHATRPTLAVMRRNGWVTEGRYNRQAPVTTAGLIAVGVDMDAIHAKAIAENTLRNADVDLCVAIADERRRLSVSGFRNVDLMALNNVMDAIHGEAIRENNVRDAASAEQLHPSYKLFNRAVREGKSYRAAMDILHAEALAENGPWTNRLSVEGRQAVRDAAHTAALEEHRQRLYGRTHLGTLIGPTGIACNAEFRGMATSSSPRVADVTCPDCLAAFRRPRVCHLASPGDEVAGCGASVGPASLVASSNIDVNVTCPECRSIIDVPVDMDAIHAEALAFELIMYGETADRDKAKAHGEALHVEPGDWHGTARRVSIGVGDAVHPRGAVGSDRVFGKVLLVDGVSIKVSWPGSVGWHRIEDLDPHTDQEGATATVAASLEDDGGWGQPDGMLDTTEVQRTHDQIREEAFRAVRLPAYCGSDWAHEPHGGCGGSTVDMPSPPVANTPAEARTGTPDRVAAVLDELAALHRDAHKLHLDVLTGRVNRIASILRGEGGV